jgi:hypothetical protein
VFEYMVLRSIFGHKRDEVAGHEENCIMRKHTLCTVHKMILE